MFHLKQNPHISQSKNALPSVTTVRQKVQVITISNLTIVRRTLHRPVSRTIAKHSQLSKTNINPKYSGMNHTFKADFLMKSIRKDRIQQIR